MANSVADRLPVIGDRGNHLEYAQYYMEQSQGAPPEKKQKITPGEAQPTVDIVAVVKYYNDCAKYYRDLGDHNSASQYAQYALHYSKLQDEKVSSGVEKGKKGNEITSKPGVQEDEVEVQIVEPVKILKVDQNLVSPVPSVPVKPEVKSLVDGYDSE